MRFAEALSQPLLFPSPGYSALGVGPGMCGTSQNCICICKPSMRTPICKFKTPMIRPSKSFCSHLQSAFLIKRLGG